MRLESTERPLLVRPGRARQNAVARFPAPLKNGRRRLPRPPGRGNQRLDSGRERPLRIAAGAGVGGGVGRERLRGEDRIAPERDAGARLHPERRPRGDLLGGGARLRHARGRAPDRAPTRCLDRLGQPAGIRPYGLRDPRHPRPRDRARAGRGRGRRPRARGGAAGSGRGAADDPQPAPARRQDRRRQRAAVGRRRAAIGRRRRRRRSGAGAPADDRLQRGSGAALRARRCGDRLLGRRGDRVARAAPRDARVPRAGLRRPRLPRGSSCA